MKKSAFFLAFCLGVLFFVPFRWAVASSLPDQKTVSSALSSLSIPFVENKGQIDRTVAYYAKTMGATLFVTKNGEIVYGFPDLALIERIPGLASHPKGLIPSKTSVSSFTGKDPSRWQKNLSTYTEVSLGEITPGITIGLHAYGGKIEKIITVSPHTDPSIAITVEGASSLGLADTGELIVHTDKGELAFSKPIAYQEINGTRVPVPIAYVLVRTEASASYLSRPTSNVSYSYSFSLGFYDHSYPLTIDPILQSTYLGGSSSDEASALALGADGVYVTGSTGSADFPGTTGGAQPANSSSSDAFVALLSSDLTSLTQSTYLGGSSNDYAYALTLGADGVYVAGTTSSIDFPGTTGGAQPAHGGGDIDGFVALLSFDLTSLIQSTYLGGSNYDNASDFALGADGIYVMGSTRSNDFPGATGGAQPAHGGDYDAFVALLSFDLTSLAQSTYLGGSNYDDASGFAVGPDGVYVAGTTYSNDFPGIAGGVQPVPGSLPEVPAPVGTPDVFVALLSSDLISLTRSTYLGGSGTDVAGALALGADGVYVAGFTFSNNFPGTIGGAQPAIEGNYDVFVALLSSDLTSLTRATYLGGSGDDRAFHFALGADGVYVAGWTLSIDFPGTTGGAQPAYGGGNYDAFVTLLSFDLTSLNQSTYLGGSNHDAAFAFAFGADGIYVAGRTDSSDFPGTTGGAQPAYGGGDYVSDAFVALLSSNLQGGPYTLSVMKTGSGTGTVTSTPAGIDCGVDCSEVLPSRSLVTITAIPDVGSVFSEWSGACSGTSPQCDLTMNDNLTVTARFKAVSSPVVLLSPNGGELAQTGNDLMISWEAASNVQTFKLLYSIDNGLTWKPITTGPISGTYYTWWTVPPIPRNTTKARVKIKGYDMAGTTHLGSDKSDGPFTIEVLKLEYPNGGEPAFASGHDITITWTTHATIRPVTQVKLFYSLDKGVTWNPFLSQPVLGSDPESHTVQLPAVQKTKSNCKVKVVLKDASGKNVGSDVSDGVFTIEPAPVP
jgi:hypothetical protein